MLITNGWMPKGAKEAIEADVAARADRWEATLDAFDKLEAEHRKTPTETITLFREGFEPMRKEGT